VRTATVRLGLGIVGMDWQDGRGTDGRVLERTGTAGTAWRVMASRGQNRNGPEPIGAAGKDGQGADRNGQEWNGKDRQERRGMEW
jgi:hypothetical protein